MAEHARVIVGGSQRRRPAAGGHAWALAHWAMGLRGRANELWFVDRAGPGPAADGMTGLLREAGVRHELLGPPDDDAASTLSNPDLLLNIMGFIPPAAVDPGMAVFVDIDPGYPQIWCELGLADVLTGHDAFVTIGENIGRSNCLVPDCGIDWMTTPPPVALDLWPRTPPGRSYTGVCTWRNPYGRLDWAGGSLGSRVHEFRQFLELPRLVDADFELALDIDTAETDDLRALERNGWRLVDPAIVAGTPWSYRSYIQGSRAEISIAQNIYVGTRNGWVSDRTVCYLASGKPVLAQDTGFTDNYPVGEGLVAFSTLEEAAAGVEEIERNYERHSDAARHLAEEYFDADKVLARILTGLGVLVEVGR